MRATILLLFIAASVAVLNAQRAVPTSALGVPLGLAAAVIAAYVGGKKKLEECRSQALKLPPCTEEAEAATNGSGATTASFCKCD